MLRDPNLVSSGFYTIPIFPFEIENFLVVLDVCTNLTGGAGTMA